MEEAKKEENKEQTQDKTSDPSLEIQIYEPEQVQPYTPKNQEHPKQSTENKNNNSHVQVYDIITGKDPSWQGIIYDLITSEQLDPWDIDIGKLCQGYFEKIKELEESNFFVSSKILFAASLLLRIKSEILLNTYIKEIDEVLFGKKEEINKIIERIEIDEDELPILIPKSPMPRLKKVTVEELISALDKAITTESRRIHKEIEKKQTERLAYIDIPKVRRTNVKDRIRQLYAKILTGFKHPNHKDKIKLPYTHFAGTNKDERIACFLPMLHLSNNKKLWLEQEEHFDEIYIYLLDIFKKHFPDHDHQLKELEQELKQEIKQIEKEIKDEHLKKVQEINKDFENPVGDLIGS